MTVLKDGADPAAVLAAVDHGRAAITGLLPPGPVRIALTHVLDEVIDCAGTGVRGSPLLTRAAKHARTALVMHRQAGMKK